MSPWDAPVGSTKKLGIPTLEKVAVDFLHMKEFFPTPENIIFPFTFIIRFIASAKELLKTYKKKYSICCSACEPNS